jgi:hypothetical protein
MSQTLGEKKPQIALYGPSGTSELWDEQSSRRSGVGRGWTWAALISTFVLYLLYSQTHHCSRSQHVLPLTPTFINHCDSILEPPTNTYTDRISRLTTSLEPNTIYITEPGTSSEYFIGGFSSRDWWLSERPLLIALTPSKNITILTARFEQSRAELVELPKEIRDITNFVPWLESESPYEVLKNYLGSEVGRVVVDGQVRSFITEGLDGAGFTSATKEEGERIKEIRERKDEREIELLRCANQVCHSLWIELMMR